jgi:hypothetical protein
MLQLCKPHRIFAAALIALALPSCSTSVQPSGWLQDYHRLGHVGGVPIEQLYIEPEFDIRNFRTLYIAPVQIDPLAYRRKGEEDHVKAERLGVALRKVLEQEIKDLGIFEVVSTDPYFMTVHEQALTLQTRITEINSGNPRQRVMIGFGAGATEVQIEGKIFEHKTCRTLVEFADRRLHPGGAMLWGNKKASDSEFLIGIDMKGILDGIVKLFIFLREEGPPNNQR